jgi:two-component sensor histidine kinase
VRLEQQPGRIRLAVEDDGVGMREGPPRGTGLGGRLIRSMAKSLDAVLSYEARERGVRAVLDIPSAGVTAPAPQGAAAG